MMESSENATSSPTNDAKTLDAVKRSEDTEQDDEEEDEEEEEQDDDCEAEEEEDEAAAAAHPAKKTAAPRVRKGKPPEARSSSRDRASAASAPAKRTRLPAKYRQRKPTDMPRRPLSAYNLFFKDERAKILEAKKDASAVASPPPTEGEEDKKKSSLFETMAKTIAKRWKEIGKDELEHYTALAKEETARYRKEMEIYNRKLLENHSKEVKKRREKGQTTSQSGGGSSSGKRKKADRKRVDRHDDDDDDTAAASGNSEGSASPGVALGRQGAGRSTLQGATAGAGSLGGLESAQQSWSAAPMMMMGNATATRNAFLQGTTANMSNDAAMSGGLGGARAGLGLTGLSAISQQQQQMPAHFNVSCAAPSYMVPSSNTSAAQMALMGSSTGVAAGGVGGVGGFGGVSSGPAGPFWLMSQPQQQQQQLLAPQQQPGIGMLSQPFMQQYALPQTGMGLSQVGGMDFTAGASIGGGATGESVGYPLMSNNRELMWQQMQLQQQLQPGGGGGNVGDSSSVLYQYLQQQQQQQQQALDANQQYMLQQQDGLSSGMMDAQRQQLLQLQHLQQQQQQFREDSDPGRSNRF